MGIGKQFELEKTGRIESETKRTNKQKELRIENWSLVTSTYDPYKAPEQMNISLYGNVYNHPRFQDGRAVLTSTIVGKKGGKVVTFSGSHYTLGKVNEEYEKNFPGAKKHIMSTLKEV